MDDELGYGSVCLCCDLGSTHRSLLLVCSGKRDCKPEIAFHFKVCNINVSNILKGGRTMMMLIFFWQYMIRMLLTVCFHQSQ